MTYPNVWPGRCTVRGCDQIAGVVMTRNYGQQRWARCDDHLGCDDDGNPFADQSSSPENPETSPRSTPQGEVC